MWVGGWVGRWVDGWVDEHAKNAYGWLVGRVLLAGVVRSCLVGWCLLRASQPACVAGQPVSQRMFPASQPLGQPAS